MLVVLAKNLTFLTEYDSGPTVLETDYQPMGEANYASVVENVKALVGKSGGTPDLDCQAQGSNDGLEWVDISGFAITGTQGTGPFPAEKEVGYAYLRFQLTLDSNGTSSGDWAAVTLDLHANLVEK